MSPVVPPSRRGACPALTAPMATGDGLLVRLVPVDGALSPQALIGLCEAASVFGNGVLEVTARGSLQIRGLSAETVGPLNEAVNALGITAREGVPLDVSPLAGLEAGARSDARALAAQIRATIAPFAARLGPKVSVVLDDGGAISLAALKADIRLTLQPAAAPSAPVQWAIALAGDAATARPLGHLPETRLVAVVADLLDRLAQMGTAARMADLLCTTDLPALQHQLALSPPSQSAAHAPSVLPSIPGTAMADGTDQQQGDNLHRSSCPGLSRASTQIGLAPASQARDIGAARMAGSRLVSTSAGSDQSRKHPTLMTSPAMTDPAGRPPASRSASEPHPAPAPIATFPLADGTVALGLGLPFGHVDSETLKSLVAAAQAAGVRHLRPAPGRVLLATGLSVPGAAELRAAASTLGFLTEANDPRRFVAACAGAPACASGHIPARALAPEVAATLAPILDGSLEVHVSGCPKGCAHPATAALTLVGLEADAMDKSVALVREGKAGDATQPQQTVAALLPTLARFAAALAAARHPGETSAEAMTRLTSRDGAEPSLLEFAVLEPAS